MSRVAEMLLGLQPRMPMCSVCRERLHILKKSTVFYYCIECFPQSAKETLEIMGEGDEPAISAETD